MLFPARVLVAGIFALAASGKTRHFHATSWTFRQLMQAIFPRVGRLAPVLAAGVIASELAVALAFLVGRGLEYSSLGAFALIAAFLGASAVGHFQRLDVPCNCFDASTEELGTKTGLRALLLIVPVGICAIGERAPGAWWPHSLRDWVVSSSLLAFAFVGARWAFTIVHLWRFAVARRDSAAATLHASAGGSR